jgi:chorismate synthase
MITILQRIKETGDSVGGVVEMIATGLPAGLGDPVYDKLEAKLAAAMMSIPATKGFEIGDGFASARMKGSQHNDTFGAPEDDAIAPLTNHSGGTLGGISTGLPIVARVAFKPTSSIMLPQQTVDLSGNPALFQLPKGSRHDPCVAIRAVPVVEAMLSVVLIDCCLKADAYLSQHKTQRVEKILD